MSDHYNHAKANAADMVLDFQEQILEQIIDSGQASDDLLNDYLGGDAYHHENHVDKWYNLFDAAELLEELRDFEESDYGLWDGQMPREAIATQAAFTYGNAVYSLWCDLIREINTEAELIVDDFDDQIADAEAAEAEASAEDPYTGPTADDLETEKREALAKMIDQSAREF